MSDSPLLRHARERLAKQRELERRRWETQPAALQKSTLLWILRIIAFLILMALVYCRMTGHRIF